MVRVVEAMRAGDPALQRAFTEFDRFSEVAGIASLTERLALKRDGRREAGSVVELLRQGDRFGCDLDRLRRLLEPDARAPRAKQSLQPLPTGELREQLPQLRKRCRKVIEPHEPETAPQTDLPARLLVFGELQ